MISKIKKLKFLIFGSLGMAGNTIATYLKDKEHNVTGFSRQITPEINTIVGDVNNIDLVKKTITEGEYDIIINCIGILNQFAENNHDEAIYLNSYFPHLLVSLTKNMKTKIFLLSTDCIFSGEKGKYVENDIADGKSFYSRTKALGEVVDDKNLTFRTSIIGPDIKEEGIGLLNWFMKQNNSAKGFSNVIWTGVTTLELAKTMEIAAFSNITGLINIVNDKSISKYNLLLLFNKYLRKGKLEIIPFKGIVSDKSLIRLNYELDYHVSDYDTMIFEMTIWIKDHMNKYPHYKF